MMASVEMYEHFDIYTSDYGGSTVNLLTDSHCVSLSRVLDWQFFCNSFFALADQLSDDMVAQLITKSLHHTVRQDVAFDIAELPEHQRGGAITIKIAMDKLASDSFEIQQCIQRGLTSFNITSYPQQNVVLAGQHVTTLGKVALQYQDLPPPCLFLCSSRYSQVLP
jgi:hypothetical protein